jgi:hypothetical protein
VKLDVSELFIPDVSSTCVPSDVVSLAAALVDGGRDPESGPFCESPLVTSWLSVPNVCSPDVDRPGFSVDCTSTELPGGVGSVGGVDVTVNPDDEELSSVGTADSSLDVLVADTSAAACSVK